MRTAEGEDNATEAGTRRAAASRHLTDERPARNWWISETTTDPSPTADATRLTEPRRTSPTAYSPGTVVSCGPATFQRPRVAGLRVGSRSGEPYESRPTSAGSQSVRGLAPIITNRPARVSCSSPVLPGSACYPTPAGLPRVHRPPRYSGAPGSWAGRRWHRRSTQTCWRRGLAPRTSMCTDEQYRARCRAAWPAELPAPTTAAESRSALEQPRRSTRNRHLGHELFQAGLRAVGRRHPGDHDSTRHLTTSPMSRKNRPLIGCSRSTCRVSEPSPETQAC